MPTVPEAGPGARNPDLDGLSPKDKAETQEILGEIEKADAPSKPVAPAGAPDSQPNPDLPNPPAKPADKKDEPANPAPKPGDPATPPKTPQGEPRREATLMPEWQHKAAENKWNKEKGELMQKIEDLSKAHNPAPGSAPAQPAKPNEDVEAELQKLAEQSGISIDALKGIYALAAKNQNKLPEEVAKGLADIQDLKTKKEMEVELAQFGSDFDQKIVPLIKAEYGNDVPADAITKVKELLQGLAYSESYKKVPYTAIYKGLDEFRGLVPAAKRGAELTRGGFVPSKNNPDGPNPSEKPFEEWTEDDLKDPANAARLDAYMDHMEKAEKKGSTRRA